MMRRTTSTKNGGNTSYGSRYTEFMAQEQNLVKKGEFIYLLGLLPTQFE